MNNNDTSQKDTVLLYSLSNAAFGAISYSFAKEIHKFLHPNKRPCMLCWLSPMDSNNNNNHTVHAGRNQMKLNHTRRQWFLCLKRLSKQSQWSKFSWFLVCGVGWDGMGWIESTHSNAPVRPIVIVPCTVPYCTVLYCKMDDQQQKKPSFSHFYSEISTEKAAKRNKEDVSSSS